MLLSAPVLPAAPYDPASVWGSHRQATDPDDRSMACGRASHSVGRRYRCDAAPGLHVGMGD